MILHISSVHVFDDPRIQKHLKSSKECFFMGISESKSNKNLSFFKTNTALTRILFNLIINFNIPKNVKKIVFHDPELLIPLGLLKAIKGKNIKIYFDAHEDVLKDMKQKIWLSKIIRFSLYCSFFLLFKMILPNIDGVITVNNRLSKSYFSFNKNIYIIPNYPFESPKKNEKKISGKLRDLRYCYIGSISLNRGSNQILRIAKESSKKVELIGKFTDQKLESEFKSDPSWSNINYHGYLNLKDASKIIENCDVGLLLMEDTETFRDSLPVKIFDYAKENLLIMWTGNKQSFYSDYLSRFSALHVGETLETITINFEDQIEFQVQNNLSDFTWQKASREFYK